MLKLWRRILFQLKTFLKGEGWIKDVYYELIEFNLKVVMVGKDKAGILEEIDEKFFLTKVYTKVPVFRNDPHIGMYIIIAGKIYYKRDKSTFLTEIYNDLLVDELNIWDTGTALLVVGEKRIEETLFFFTEGEVKILLKTKDIWLEQEKNNIIVEESDFNNFFRYYYVKENVLCPICGQRFIESILLKELQITYLFDEKKKGIVYRTEKEIKILAKYSMIEELPNCQNIYVGKDNNKKGILYFIICQKNKKSNYVAKTIEIKGDRIEKLENSLAKDDYEMYKVYRKDGINIIVIKKDKIINEKFYPKATEIDSCPTFGKNEIRYKIRITK